MMFLILVILSLFTKDSSFDLFRWIRDQQKSEGVTPGEDVYIILRLDGRVRRSGKVSSNVESLCPIKSKLNYSSNLIVRVSLSKCRMSYNDNLFPRYT